MFSILSLPLVPILALVIILPLIGWQINLHLKEKRNNKTPNIPQINKNQKEKNNSSGNVKNVTLISHLKMNNKSPKKFSAVFSIVIVIFVVINVIIMTFYLNNRKISYLPRASELISPTTVIGLDSSLSLTPTLISTQIPTQTPTQILTETPTLVSSPTVTLLKPTPTVAPIINPKPTLIAQAYTLPTTPPTATPTLRPTITPTPKITTVPTLIPVVGLNHFSIFLGVLSFFFLVLGLII